MPVIPADPVRASKTWQGYAAPGAVPPWSTGVDLVLAGLASDHRRDVVDQLGRLGVVASSGWADEGRWFLCGADVDGPVFVHVVADASGRARLEREVVVRSVVRARGGPLTAPEVLFCGGGLLVSRGVVPTRVPGPQDCDLLVAALAEVGRLELPAQAAPPAAPAGRAGAPATRWRAVRRRAALLRSPVPVTDLLRSRALLRGIAPAGPAHRDLHAGNLLLGAGTDRVAVVDWELAGEGLPGEDAAQLTATLPPESGPAIWAAALAGAPAGRTRDWARVRYAVAVRTMLLDYAPATPSDAFPERAAALLALLPGLRHAAR